MSFFCQNLLYRVFDNPTFFLFSFTGALSVKCDGSQIDSVSYLCHIFFYFAFCFSVWEISSTLSSISLINFRQLYFLISKSYFLFTSCFLLTASLLLWIHTFLNLSENYKYNFKNLFYSSLIDFVSSRAIFLLYFDFFSFPNFWTLSSIFISSNRKLSNNLKITLLFHVLIFWNSDFTLWN